MIPREHRALPLWPLPAILPECSPASRAPLLGRFSLLTISTNRVISSLSQHLPLDLSCLLFPFHQPWVPPVVYLPVYLLPRGRQPCARSIRGGRWRPARPISGARSSSWEPGPVFLAKLLPGHVRFLIRFLPRPGSISCSSTYSLEIPSNS